MPAKRTPHLVEVKKELSLEDFKAFFQKIYFSKALELKDPDGQYSRTQINEISDFLQKFQTNPSNMKERLENRGATTTDISTMPLCIIAEQARTYVMQIKNQEESALHEWERSRTTRLLEDLPKNPNKSRKSLAVKNTFERELQEEQTKTDCTIAVQSCIPLISYLQQEFTYLELSIAPESRIRCTPQYNSVFESLCAAVEANLQNIEEHYPRNDSKANKNSVCKMVQTLFPGKTSFSESRDQICDQIMIEIGALPYTFHKPDGGYCDYSYRTHIMNKEKFVINVRGLNIWNGDEGIEPADAFRLASELFNSHEEFCLSNSHMPTIGRNIGMKTMNKIFNHYKTSIDNSRIAINP